MLACLWIGLATLASPSPSPMPAVRAFDTPGAALAAIFADEGDPRVVAFGEYHQLEGGPRARSALSHFGDELLSVLMLRASDLVVETWVTNGRCGAVEKQAVKKVEQTIERPPATEDELVTLIRRAAAVGLHPHVLTVSCADYRRIFRRKKVDYVALLSVVTRLLRDEITRAIALGPRTVVVYGGALHNDLAPRPELAAYSFGPAVRDQTHGRYLEVDLYVPEYVEHDREVTAEPWWPDYQRAAKSGKTILVKRAPQSYVILFPRS